MISTSLPSHWQIKKLGDVCEKITDGTHFTPTYVANGIPFISVKDINNEKISFEKCKYISEEEHNTLFKRCNPEPGDILMTKSGTIGRLAIVPNKKFSLFVSVALLKIKKEWLSSKFALLALKNHLSRLNVSSELKGGVIKNYHLEDLRLATIVVPPLPEQEAIVAKIESLFAELEAGKSAILAAREQIKLYRQSLLKAAFEGKLTEKGKKPLETGQLPEGWKWVKLGEVCKTIDGDRGSNYPKKEEFSKEGYCLFLSTKNVRKNGFDFSSELLFIDEKKDSSLRGGKLIEKDVVITTRGTLGNVAVFEENCKYKEIRINSGMLILRSEHTNLFNKFLMNFIMSEIFAIQLKSKQTGTAQPQIPANILREIELPLPPLSTQEKIVEILEEKLGECDALDATIEKSLIDAELLRQSILKEAFEGRLVKMENEKKGNK